MVGELLIVGVCCSSCAAVERRSMCDCRLGRQNYEEKAIVFNLIHLRA